MNIAAAADVGDPGANSTDHARSSAMPVSFRDLPEAFEFSRGADATVSEPKVPKKPRSRQC